MLCKSFIIHISFPQDECRHKKYLLWRSLIASRLLESFVKPIPGDNTFGDNVQYDPEFDRLKAEIGKLGDTDYEQIELSATTILAEKSKDLRAFTFVSLSYLRNENWESLADVFDAITQLAIQDYDALFPARPRARQMAIKWLSEERYQGIIAEKKPGEADHEHIARLCECLGKLKSILEEKYPDGSPFPAGLFSAAQKWEKATKPKPAPQPTQEGSPASAPATAQAQTPGVPPATPAAAGSAAPAASTETPKQAQISGKQIAGYLIQQEPTKPIGYRLIRCLRWDILEKAPPSNGGKTQLQGPNDQQRKYFQGLMGNSDWKTALPAAEKAFTGTANHLWLDLQRIAATACRELGAEYESVRQAIMFETALLIKRIPDLMEMLFSDGSAFCDEATKDWLRGDVAAVLSSGAGGGGGAAGVSSGALEEERKQANAMVGAGKLEDAMDFLQTQISASSIERDNFRRSILLSNILLSNKRSDIALAILESLDDKINQFHLERWDPDMAVEAWILLIKVYKVAQSNKPQPIQIAMQEKQNTILQKLSRTDPKAAFKVQA